VNHAGTATASQPCAFLNHRLTPICDAFQDGDGDGVMVMVMAMTAAGDGDGDG
jgi:hypothetical protein